MTVRALPSVYEVEATEEPDLEAATQASAPSAFHALGLNHDLCQGLASLGIVAPTEIQKLAIPAIRKGGDFLMTSHTGSGKTLAYLLPIVRVRAPLCVELHCTVHLQEQRCRSKCTSCLLGQHTVWKGPPRGQGQGWDWM